MTRTKMSTKLIAMILCLAMIISMGAVATGEEIQDEPTASEGTQPPSTEGTEPPEGGGTEGGTETPPEGGTETPPEGGTETPPEGGTETPPEGGTETPPEGGTETPPDDGTLKVSAELLRVLKQLEGFAPYAYWDYKQWSIGYGSECPKGMETYYQSNPISEEYAEELLRGELDYFEDKINDFIKRNELTVSQHQYDALVSFTYNTGANWTSGTTGNFNGAVISGDTGSHFIYGMMLWSMAGNRHTLINRRIVEMNIYANGIYAVDPFKPEAIPDRYRIAFMDGNGGVVKYDEHGFDAEQPIAIKTQFKTYPTGPDETGAVVTYVLDGWYTERIGGTKVEMLDTSIPTGTVLYAHWKTPNGTPVVIPRQESGLKITVNVTGTGVNVRSGPDTYFAIMSQANPGDVLEISEVVSRGGLVWGRFGDSWIALKYTDYDDALKKELPKWGKITGTTLNVRKGAGTSYDLVEDVQKKLGDLVLVTEWKSDSDNTMMWGKIAEGWIALPYVSFDGVLPPDQTVQSVEVSQSPAKLTYIHKLEALDLTGGKLLVTFADGSTTTLDITPEMVTGFDNTNVGANTITVTYGEKTATFEVQIVKAKVVFQLEDGTVISEKEYLVGDTVEIPADPTKASDNTYKYIFAGWDREVVACDGNAVYTATFTKEYIDYTVKFLNEDGSVISEQTYHWGDEITAPADPSKSADNTYTYAFAGWDQEVIACAGDATYTATYQATYVEYTVTFQYEDGTVIKQYTLHYGDAVTAPENPTPPEDFVFVSWDQPITSCQGNATYTAVFAPREYLPGDCNKDEVVNDQDAVYLIRHIYFPNRYPVSASVDYNGDGVLNDQDAVYLIRHIYFPNRYPLN